MATLGRDADVLLWHAAFNGGEPLGFLLDFDTEEKNLVIERTNWYSSEGSWFQRVKITLLLVLANDQTNPDGSVRTIKAATQYGQYLGLVGMVEGLGLALPFVSFEGLKCSAFVCQERHQLGRIEIKLVLNSGNWPETQKVVGGSTIVEVPPAPVAEPGSLWFETNLNSGWIATI